MVWSDCNIPYKVQMEQFVIIEMKGNGLRSPVALFWRIWRIGDSPENCTNAKAARGKLESTVTPSGGMANPAGVKPAAAVAARAINGGGASLFFKPFVSS